MFLNDQFLLKNDIAQKLFHDHAKQMPIIDYHCHLDPKEIYENKHFKNLTEAWLAGDHYKWRLMRANGVPESYITGNASDYDKFLAWARTVPKTIGNPLYTWTHLELKRFFGIDLLLNEENAPLIWDLANEKLTTDDFKRRNIITNSNVKVVCTTDDPIDDLHYHQLLKDELSRLIGFYHAHNWTMQLHIHAYRNTNSALFDQIGPDTGYDGVNDLPLAIPLQRLLNRAEKDGKLPKTILYSLNPNDFFVLATLMGSFQKNTPGKLQLGSGWWYNDTRAGMRHQLTVLSDVGLLSSFVGMLTDSRSFLSYTRHEYFRRVLCEFIGEIVERGEAPADEDLLGSLVEAISYDNAKQYFGFERSYVENHPR